MTVSCNSKLTNVAAWQEDHVDQKSSYVDLKAAAFCQE